MHGFFSSRRNIIASIGGVLALAGLCWNLSQRQVDEHPLEQPADGEVLKDEVEDKPEVHEMSPVAPVPPQAVPEAAVKPAEPERAMPE